MFCPQREKKEADTEQVSKSTLLNKNTKYRLQKKMLHTFPNTTVPMKSETLVLMHQVG